MVALGLAAVVTAHRILRRLLVDRGRLVVWVAHPRGAQFGQYGFEGRPCFGGQVAAEVRHAIVFRLAQHDAALAGPLLVAEFPIGVEPVHDSLGVFGQLVGTIPAGLAGQIGLGGFPGAQVDLGG